MSELLNQLAEQAKKSIPVGRYDVAEWIERYNYKFAELIIEECAEQARFEAINLLEKYQVDYDFFQALAVVEGIKQHFFPFDPKKKTPRKRQTKY